MQVNIPIYPDNATDFTDSGYGFLTDVLSATIKEAANENGSSTYELTMLYPYDGVLADKLRIDSLIKIPIGNDYMIFETYKHSEDTTDGTMTVNAAAYGYRASGMVIKGEKLTVSGDIQKIIDTAIAAVDDFPSNLKITADFKQSMTIEKEFTDLGDLFTHLINLSDGYMRFTKEGILFSKEQVKRDLVLRDDHQIANMKFNYDTTRIFNIIYPFHQAEQSSGGEGASTQQVKVFDPPIKSAEPMKFIKYWRGKKLDTTNNPIGANYFSKNRLDTPLITIECDMGLDEDLSNYNIFDKVGVYSAEFDYSAEVTLKNKDFDVLNQYYTSIDLGSFEHSIYDDTKNDVNNLNNRVDNVETSTEDKLNEQDQKVEEKISSQQEKVDEFVKKVTEDVNKVATDLYNKIQNKAEKINYGETAITANNLTLGADGLLFYDPNTGRAKVAVGADGSIYADGIYGNTLEGIHVIGGTFTGGSYDAAAYYRSTGSGGVAVMSGDYGFSHGESHIGPTQVVIPDTIINGGLNVNGDVWVTGTINGHKP